MEAEGEAWEENPAVYGYFSMQVDFIVSAKVHCQFPVHVLCDRGPCGGGQLCATVLRAKRNKYPEGRGAFHRALHSLSSYLGAISGGTSEVSLGSLTPLQKLLSVLVQSHSLKNNFLVSDWGSKYSSSL